MSESNLRTFDVLVEVSPLAEIADPQGSTIERALSSLGFEDVANVRVGKAIRLQVQANSAAEAENYVTQMCDRLLVNPVIENARVQVSAVPTTVPTTVPSAVPSAAPSTTQSSN